MHLLPTPPVALSVISAIVAALAPHVVLAVIATGGALIFALDFLARRREAVELENSIRHGFLTQESKAVARKMGRSYCGRGVAIAAMRRHGLAEPMKAFYRARGYHAWSIFPDGAPACFVKPSFWKRTVGL